MGSDARCKYISPLPTVALRSTTRCCIVLLVLKALDLGSHNWRTPNNLLPSQATIMASDPVAAVPSLAQTMGQLGDGALTFAEAMEQVAGNKLNPLTKPIKKDRLGIKGALFLGDMPLEEMGNGMRNQFCDVILNHNFGIDSPDDVEKFKNEIHEKCINGQFKDLPAPLKQKRSRTYHTQCKSPSSKKRTRRTCTMC